MGSLRTGEGRLQSGRAGLLSKRADDGLAGLRGGWGAPHNSSCRGLHSAQALPHSGLRESLTLFSPL